MEDEQQYEESPAGESFKAQMRGLLGRDLGKKNAKAYVVQEKR